MQLSILRETARSLFFVTVGRAERATSISRVRHVTRCRIFLFVVDVAGSEGRNPVEDLRQLRKELDLYDPLLSQRPWFVIANKMDLPNAHENLNALRKKFPKIDIVPISAAKAEGIDELKKELAEWLEL